jgi:polyisoprenyl-phosphate glycosyltransferase
MSSKVILSIVVPVYNERDGVEALVAELFSVLEAIGLSFEIILIDDGSKDGSWDIIERQCARHCAVKGIRLSRNFGQQMALSAGLEAAAGEAVITMDADLQHPPAVIKKMVEKWRTGAKIVNAIRDSAQGASLIKRWCTVVFYRLMDFWSEVPIGHNMPDFRLLDRSVVDSFLQLKERSRFIRGLINWLGFDIVTVHFDAPKRRGAKSRYNFGKMFHLAIDAITSFTAFPLKIALYIGLGISFLSAGYLAYILYITLILREAVKGWASVISVVLFLGGCQMIFLGIIGEYILKMYNELKQRPLYIVSRRLNMEVL